MAYKFNKSGQLKEPAADELAAADADSFIIVLDKGTAEDGRPYWVYIGVKPSKYKEFMRLTAERKPKRFKDYGDILKFGFDKEVPAAVKEEMKRKHGCDDHYMATLAQEVKIAQKAFLKQQEDNRIGDIVAMLKKKQG